MSKKILVISTSLRKDSNSQALAEAFAKGAESAGHEAELISLRGKQISFCRGCFACLKRGRCVIEDDAPAIVEEMHGAQVLAFATPIYYYEMSGQMKTQLDRANSLFDGDYAFTQVYLLAAAAEDEEQTPRRAISGLEGWVECFPRAALAGTVFAGGITDQGDIQGHPALKRAYDMGAGIK